MCKVYTAHTRAHIRTVYLKASRWKNTKTKGRHQPTNETKTSELWGAFNVERTLKKGFDIFLCCGALFSSLSPCSFPFSFLTRHCLCRYYFLKRCVHLPDKALINYIFFLRFAFFPLFSSEVCAFFLLLKHTEKWHFTHSHNKHTTEPEERKKTVELCCYLVGFNKGHI